MKHSISLVILVLLPWALAVSRPKPLHIPVLRRNTVSDRVAGLSRAIGRIKRKYGFTGHTKRNGASYIPLTDEEDDFTYSGVVSIGTPPQDFNLMINTESSDIWVTTDCTTCPSNVTMFDPSKSSTYVSYANMSYRSDGVTGFKSEDTVTFGGLTVQNQAFLSVNDMLNANEMLAPGTSGAMGLGFPDNSILQTTPFWQELYNQNSLPELVFAIYLERQANLSENVETAPGGVFTLGGTNSSLYTGDIEFIEMPNGTTPSYWLQQVQSVTIQGTSISVPSNMTLAAIELGASFLVAPAPISQSIWENVPGAVPLSGDYEGMYGFPCSTSVNMSISFGGTSWAIDPADINSGPLESEPGMCLSSVLSFPGETDVGSSSSWIIGDVFLKNVYSVFRANPPTVGFARLATLSNLNGTLDKSGTSGTLGGNRVARSLLTASLSVVIPLLACFCFAL